MSLTTRIFDLSLSNFISQLFQTYKKYIQFPLHEYIYQDLPYQKLQHQDNKTHHAQSVDTAVNMMHIYFKIKMFPFMKENHLLGEFVKNVSGQHQNFINQRCQMDKNIVLLFGNLLMAILLLNDCCKWDIAVFIYIQDKKI